MDAIAEVIEIAPAIENAAAAATSSEPTPEATKKAVAKSYDTLDAVLQAITEQDELIKTMRTHMQEMLATNTALKRSIKAIVQNAEKNDEIEQELTSARKKLAMLKTFING